jgi:hypothetical protein
MRAVRALALASLELTLHDGWAGLPLFNLMTRGGRYLPRQ